MNFTSLMNDENMINKIVYLMETDDSANAPADSVKWAKNVFRSRAAEPHRSFVQKILAVLQLDLEPHKAAFGERSASAATARQMLFGADENSIDLRIAKIKTRYAIGAQILGDGFTNAEITLAGDSGRFTTKANGLSEFKLDGVSKGDYKLTLTGDSKEIVIENIRVG